MPTTIQTGSLTRILRNLVPVFLIKFGWPRIKGFFVQGLDVLDSESRAAFQ